jgi:glycosyltransferase involved in cell wall biosynthesis
MEKITFCIPSKNNLRYLKNSITSIKENSFIEHDIIVYVDMSHDGTEEWLIENNIRYLKNETANAKGIAYGYNRCIEAANTNIVCMFHADMYMGKGFDINILKHLTKGSVVSGTRIEPPLHPEGKEKIVMNFGMYPEDFTKEVFDKFVEEAQNTYKDVTTQGIFAPWAIYKDDVTTIGMHDEVFHSYHEDSDIFNRFILSGYKNYFVTPSTNFFT